MKTTFEELNQLFRLKDSDYRQIKAGLVNKIRMLDANNVLVEDEELKTFLTDFRTGGSYATEEVCKHYNISKSTLLQLVRNKIISSFQLVTAKGSKTLFLKSELDRENNILLVHQKKTDKTKLARFADSFFQMLASEWQMKEGDYEMFKMYYFSDMSLEEIGEEHDISGERVRQKILRNNRKLLLRFSDVIKSQRSVYWDKRNYVSLEQKYNKLKNFIEGLDFLKTEFNMPVPPVEPVPEQYLLKITDLDFSVRALNCLKVADIETIGDLMNYKKKDLYKFRNFGKKSMKEIEKVMAKLGIAY